MNYEKAIEFVLSHEGGYVNDPDDPGGETKWGISKRAHPEEDIKNMTRDRAKEIYFEDYWIRASCDKLPHKFRLAHLDLAVNSGVRTANKLLQRFLGVSEDGIIGKITIGMADVKAEKPYALENLLAERQVNYSRIIVNRYRDFTNRGKPHIEALRYALKYSRGWSRRPMNLLTYERNNE